MPIHLCRPWMEFSKHAFISGSVFTINTDEEWQRLLHQIAIITSTENSLHSLVIQKIKVVHALSALSKCPGKMGPGGFPGV